jgi:hypothetical protein
MMGKYSERGLSLPSHMEGDDDFDDLGLIKDEVEDPADALEIIEQTMRLTTQIIQDCQDVMTQTPDDWMSDIHEPIFQVVSVENDLTENHDNSLPPIGARVDVRYEMSVPAAEELIALIYQAKVSTISCCFKIDIMMLSFLVFSLLNS